jgi:hypothetical protein
MEGRRLPGWLRDWWLLCSGLCIGCDFLFPLRLLRLMRDEEGIPGMARQVPDFDMWLDETRNTQTLKERCTHNS